MERFYVVVDGCSASGFSVRAFFLVGVDFLLVGVGASGVSAYVSFCETGFNSC